jgi:hypothetical protein
MDNTAHIYTALDLAQSEIDRNPDRFRILNGKPGPQNPELLKMPIYPKDTKAYYPFPKPPEGMRDPRLSPESIYQGEQVNRLIYPLDQKPYYGPRQEFQVFGKFPPDQMNANQ